MKNRIVKLILLMLIAAPLSGSLACPAFAHLSNVHQAGFKPVAQPLPLAETSINSAELIGTSGFPASSQSSRHLAWAGPSDSANCATFCRGECGDADCGDCQDCCSTCNSCAAFHGALASPNAIVFDDLRTGGSVVLSTYLADGRTLAPEPPPPKS